MFAATNDAYFYDGKNIFPDINCFSIEIALVNSTALTDPTGHFSIGGFIHSITHAISRAVKINLSLFGVTVAPSRGTAQGLVRETGRTFATTPELQMVADAVCVAVAPWALPAVNAAISASVTYYSTGNFNASMKNGAVAYAATWAVQQAATAGSTYADSLGDSCTLASEHAGSMIGGLVIGGAISKAQGGKWFDSKSFMEGMAVSIAVSWVMTPSANAAESQPDTGGSDTLDEAAMKFAKENYQESYNNDEEIAKLIYELDGKYYTTDTQVTSSCAYAAQCDISDPMTLMDDVPEGGQIVASIHTHGSDITNPGGFNFFSDEDVATINDEGGAWGASRYSYPEFQGGYVVTPQRQVYFYEAHSMVDWSESGIKNLQRNVGGF